MKRLEYTTEIQNLLEDLAEGNSCYWRYQHKHHNGIIPVGHESNERVFEGEAPEFVEEGCSCYDNPYQLLQYVLDDCFIKDEDYDVVLFVGSHMGYGLDEEDIVMVEEESDVIYSLSLLDFYKFCSNADIYWNGNYNVKELYNRRVA